MLNPSTADGTVDDHTIRKCMGFALRWRMSGIRVVNLFAWRETSPKLLLGVPDLVGPDNDEHIVQATRDLAHDSKNTIVFAWGGPYSGELRRLVAARARAVRELLAASDVFCLGTSKGGAPRHPLMLSYDTQLVPWQAKE
jgi:hypothetical protein